MAAQVLLDLDHAREVWKQLDGAGQVVEVMQRPRGVLGDELDVVPGPCLPNQLGDGRPRTQDVRAQTGLAFAQEFAESIASEHYTPFSDVVVGSLTTVR